MSDTNQIYPPSSVFSEHDLDDNQGAPAGHGEDLLFEQARNEAPPLPARNPMRAQQDGREPVNLIGQNPGGGQAAIGNDPGVGLRQRRPGGDGVIVGHPREQLDIEEGNATGVARPGFGAATLNSVRTFVSPPPFGGTELSASRIQQHEAIAAGQLQELTGDGDVHIPSNAGHLVINKTSGHVFLKTNTGSVELKPNRGVDATIERNEGVVRTNRFEGDLDIERNYQRVELGDSGNGEREPVAGIRGEGKVSVGDNRGTIRQTADPAELRPMDLLTLGNRRGTQFERSLEHRLPFSSGPGTGRVDFNRHGPADFRNWQPNQTFRNGLGGFVKSPLFIGGGAVVTGLGTAGIFGANDAGTLHDIDPTGILPAGGDAAPTTTSTAAHFGSSYPVFAHDAAGITPTGDDGHPTAFHVGISEPTGSAASSDGLIRGGLDPDLHL